MECRQAPLCFTCRRVEDWLAEGDPPGSLYAVAESPRIVHQRVLLSLAVFVTQHVQYLGLGELFLSPVDVALPGGLPIMVPDLVFVHRSNSDIIGEDRIEGTPDLVVEVLSPHTACRDRKLKYEQYARAEVREYWIVDPVAQTLEVHAPARDRVLGRYGPKDMLTSPVFPYLDLPLSVVFCGGPLTYSVPRLIV